MPDFFEVFTGDLKYYWMLASIGTVIFVLQTLLLLIFGAGGDVDAEMGGIDGDVPDTDLGDFSIISFRTVIAFITFFGWGGIAHGGGGVGGFVVALICGTAMMFVTALMIFNMLKLQHSGNIYGKDIIGKTGTVYLKIPAGKAEHGTVTVFVGAGTREILAVSEEEIPNGAMVKVISQVTQNKFLVEKI